MLTPRNLAIGFAILSLVLVIASWAGGGAVAILVDPSSAAGTKIEALRDHLLGYGAWAPVIYAGVVTVEVVVAPIPGWILYPPGGVIFGSELGALLALIGNVVGAGVAFYIARGLGRERVRAWLAAADLGSLERRISERGFWVVLLLRLNPLTTSDIVSYAAGLTSMPAWKLLAGTAVGIAPLCWLQSRVAVTVLEAHPWLLLPGLGLAAIYILAPLWIWWRARRSD